MDCARLNEMSTEELQEAVQLQLKVSIFNRCYHEPFRVVPFSLAGIDE